MRGRLLVVEQIVPRRLHACVQHQDIARRDLTMLIGPGGRERTEAEFHGLFSAANLKCEQIVSAAFGFFVLEAVSRDFDV